jgi:RNA polymerase sigma-70 factor (ECF subfamily)
MVISASKPAVDGPPKALAELCELYWHPVYVFIRRRNVDVADAEDLTQAFFSRLIEKGGIGAADPERGRFRTFLLAAVKNFLANESRAQHAHKRAPERTIISLDSEACERRYPSALADSMTPDKLFERQWALTLLEAALQKLGAEHRSARKQQVFEELKAYLGGESMAPHYAETAAKLQMSETAVRVAIHRLRLRYRNLLREEVAQTLDSPADVEDELRALMQSLAQ